MAITPSAGWKIDPTNPNAVVQNNSTQMAPTAAASPLTSAPQPAGPQVPMATNPNANWQNNVQAAPAAPAPATQVTVNTGQSPAPSQSSKTAQPTTQAPGTSTLTMPANGSVVDLLNSAGQDSSFAARQQLAQQYGIQGYAGTAAQNTDLANKYIEAHKVLSSTPIPDTGAQGRSALDTYFNENQQQEDPQKTFMDSFAAMNPIEANLYQQLSGLLSSSSNQQSLTDLYKQEAAAQGIPELNMQLADMNKILNGTEDDIRDEITTAGGSVTESQVQAMVGARNKNLLKQASYLSDVINAKNDYVDHVVSLTQADRKQVSDDLDRKLGITNTLISMSERMQDNAKENYQSIVNSVGWEGLAKTLQGSPIQTANVEKMFGLAPGELQVLAAYKKPLTAQEELQNKNLELQNKKLTQDINTGPSVSTSLQNFGTASSPHYKLINSKTGATIADYGSSVPPVGAQQVALQQQNIQDIGSLLKDPAIAAAVSVGHPYYPGGTPSLATVTGAKSNFIAGIEQLRQQLTLDNLQNAKANGATFGALSEGELGLLSQSASKLGTWAVKDKAGNVTSYNIDAPNLKKELDKINNFQKLDFVLKGGDPNSVGIQQQADGSFWSKNSDGTYTKLQ